MSMPEKIDRYEIKGEVGRGGMATVFEAYDPRFLRLVAVKVLPREFMHEPEFRARFTREARTIAALEHPAIVPVYDFGEDDGQPYLVMRLMTGGSLTERLEKGPLTIDEAAEILKRIGSALDRAHQQGIVHRDLKPSNILFDQYGDAFLADFGIVRITSSSAALTASGSLVGTPSYMSPEQVYGNKELDGRSDIYALGVILYQMLTGEVPYEADTPARMMMAHVMDPVPHLMDKRPDLPVDCDQVITKAMAKERDERYETASAMTDDLSVATKRMERPAVPEAEISVPEPPTEETKESVLQPQAIKAEETAAAQPATAEAVAPRPEIEPEPKSSSFEEPTYAQELIQADSDSSKIPVWIWVLGVVMLLFCVVGAIGTVFLVAQYIEEERAEATTVPATVEIETTANGSVFDTLDNAVNEAATGSANAVTPVATETAVPAAVQDALGTRQAIEATREAAAENGEDPEEDETNGSTFDALATRQSLAATRAAEGADELEFAFGDFSDLMPLLTPVAGDLFHEPEDETIEMFYPGLEVDDFVLNAVFVNPFSIESGNFDMGVTFRQASPEEELRLVVRSDGLWNLNNRQSSGDEFVQDGNIADLLDLDADGANQITLIARAETGYFFLNEQYVATLDLSTRTNSGDIALGTGYYTVDEQEGASTAYEQFAIWPLDPIFGPEDGQLDHELDDLIKIEESDAEQRNALVSATFLNPFAASENEWDYGFSFRDNNDGTKYWLVVDAAGFWELIARFGEADTDTTITDGELDNLNIGEGESNQLTLVFWGDVGFFFLNGEFIEELSLRDITDAGDIELFTAYFFDHELEDEATGFEAFEVLPLP